MMKIHSSLSKEKINIAIVGLGQIGASIGLALAEHTDCLRRSGYDKQRSVAHQAQKMGALDTVENNLHSAARNADLLLLALPLDQVRETLASIANDLKPNVVVMDTAPAKQNIIAWVKELLPPDRHYIGLSPAFNPDVLYEHVVGLEAARADLLQGGMVWITLLENTPSEAISLAVELIHLMGAKHIFSDPLEVDGLMTLTYLLPQLTSAALLAMTVNQSGWRDSRKLTGRAYAEVTRPILLNEPEAIASTALANAKSTEHCLDRLIASLQSLRDTIHQQDQEALRQYLACAQLGYLDWWQQRITNEPEGAQTKLPSVSDSWKQLFGLRKKK